MAEGVIRFTHTEEPLVSVVVLAWRLSDVLLTSLASLRAQQAPFPFEVIVVLNGAETHVREAVRAGVSGATVITGEYNVGYGGGCNLGASVAKGKYIAFVSDDTDLRGGWLNAVVSTAEESSAIGIVSSVLLNPDGSVQEAGTRMLGDCSTMALGAGKSPEDIPELLTRRAIDYGSGAAMLIDAEAFRALGGFDPVFYPAYYEDVDMAFRLRAMGRRVVLEPSAIVGHIGRASTGRDGRYQQAASEHGREIFRERWADVLSAAPAADEPVERLCPVERTFPDRPIMRSSGMDDVATLSTSVGALKASAAASGEYILWLNRQLDEADADRDDLRNLARELRERLEDLDGRNLVGLVKWRIGLWSARHPGVASRLGRRG